MAPRRDTSQAVRGCWRGSTVSAHSIQALIRARKMPAGILWRAPGAEMVPTPRAGERVVFLSHFERGFGLPASTFLRNFLDYHRLQPHHLAANFIMTLSSFVTLCEGYLGCRPSIALFKRFFNLRAHMARTGEIVPAATEGGKVTYPKDMTDCGSCLVAAGKNKCVMPEIVQSCKNWQTTFFYVKSPDQGPDLVNLPEFTTDRPTEKFQWSDKCGAGDCDVDSQVARVVRLEREGLLPTDLAAAWLHARILPLQRRVHRLCDMSGPRDPIRLCTWRAKSEDIRARLKVITASPAPDPFRFGLPYLTRQQKPSEVRLSSDCSFSFRLLLLPLRLFSLTLSCSALHPIGCNGRRASRRPICP
jgi:Putative gypsy type transposon